MFQISVTPNPVQYGTKPPRLSIVGASPNEVISIKIVKPNGEGSKLEVTVGEDGSLQFPLFLASGIGLYQLTPWVSDVSCAPEAAPCHEFSISLMATKCSQQTGERQLELTAQTLTTQVGLPITFWLSGGEPNSVAIIHQNSANGVVNIHSAQLSQEGFATVHLTPLALTDTWIATQGYEVSDSVITSVAPDLNSPALAPDLGVLKAKWRIFNDTKLQGAIFPLALQLQNTGASTIEVSIDSVVGELTQEVPIHMKYEAIPAGSTREFTYYFSGTHSEQLAKELRVEVKGSYTGGEKFSSSTAVLIPPKKLAVGVELASIIAVPSNVVLGQAVRLDIEVANTGEADLTNVALSSVSLPDALGSMEFSGVSIPAKGVYKTSFTVVPQSTGIHMPSIDGVNITGNAYGQIVAGTQELSTTFKVTTQ